MGVLVLEMDDVSVFEMDADADEDRDMETDIDTEVDAVGDPPTIGGKVITFLIVNSSRIDPLSVTSVHVSVVPDTSNTSDPAVLAPFSDVPRTNSLAGCIRPDVDVVTCPLLPAITEI